MEFKPEDYILGFWVGWSEEFQSDFLMQVIMRDGVWHVEYRFRYHKDNLTIHDEAPSKDVKNFYKFTCTETEEVLMEKLGKFMDAIRVKYKDVEFWEVRGDFDKFRYVAAQCPSMHMKVVDREDYEKLTGGNRAEGNQG